MSSEEPKRTIVVEHPGGPHIELFIQCVVMDRDTKGGVDGGIVQASGYAVIDIYSATLMPPGEFAIRHLWPAFLAATQHAHIELPQAYRQPPSKPISS